MTTKILKTCNCCLNHVANRHPRLMTERAKIARCQRCKCRTVWSEMVADAAAEYRANLTRRTAFIEELMAEAV